MAAVIIGQARLHVTQDGVGILGARVVAGEDGAVAAHSGLVRHDRALGGIAVTATTAYGDDLSLATHQVTDGVEHIDQCVGRVGIVNNGGEALGGMQRLETSVGGMELAQLHQHFIAVDAQQNGSGSNSGEIIGVKTACEQYLNITPIELQAHSVDALLHQFAIVIGHGAQRVGMVAGRTVLQHHASHLIVNVDQGKRIGGQRIKEHLLGPQILVHGLVEVQVILGEVGKHTTGPTQTIDAVLHTGVAAHLHESIFATGLDHLV